MTGLLWTFAFVCAVIALAMVFGSGADCQRGSVTAAGIARCL
jgi:hypothetical protein